MNNCVVGIVGATGVVGTELTKLLAERAFPLKDVRFFASERSVGKEISYKGVTHRVEGIARDALLECDLLFGCATSGIAREVRQFIDGSGVVFIDNSSAFRYDELIPLVVPEINAGTVTNGKQIIANPNCCAIILCVALWPIHAAFGLKRVLVSTYQAVSGAGKSAMDEMEQQVAQYSQGLEITHQVFNEQILFNIMSHNTAIEENGFNGEENKIIKETRKILGHKDLKISVTCMRVPVVRAHVESVNVELEKPCTVEDIIEVVSKADGLKLVDDRSTNRFPTSLRASNQDLVMVGRIREDLSCANGFHFLVAGDQIRKGAALNAVQIAEKLFG